jgi:hypothetical protein
MQNIITARKLQATFTAACAALATDERAECDQLAQVHTALCEGAVAEEYAHTGGNVYVSYTLHAAGNRLLLASATFECLNVLLLPRAYSATDIDAAMTFQYDLAGEDDAFMVLQVLPYSTVEDQAGKLGPCATDEYTFAEFQATRQRVADIREASSHCIEEAMPGFVYAEGMYIAECALNTYWLLIGAHVDETSNDLAKLERVLFDYGVESGEIIATSTMQVAYISDEADPCEMGLEELISNFNESGGFEGCDAGDLREAMDNGGWFHGSHENGRYIVLNLAKLGLTFTLAMDADKLDAAIAAKRAGGAA